MDACDQMRLLSGTGVRCCNFGRRKMERSLLLVSVAIFAGSLPLYAQSTAGAAPRASAYLPEEGLFLPSPNGIWTLGSSCHGCASGQTLWLVTNADHHRRVVRHHDGIIRAGWSPDGDRFFFNEDESSDKTVAYVVDPTCLKLIELGKVIAAGDPQSTKYLGAAHTRLTANKWVDTDAVLVELTGYSDRTPIEQFDLQYQVHLSGAVSRLSVREWPIFTPEPVQR